VDALGEQHRLFEPPLDVAAQFFDEPPDCRRVGVDRLAEQLEIDGECDEVLVYAIVQIAFDPAAVGIGGEYEPLPRCPQLLDLDAQSIKLA
jgi:hypothetical protein